MSLLLSKNILLNSEDSGPIIEGRIGVYGHFTNDEEFIREFTLESKFNEFIIENKTTLKDIKVVTEPQVITLCYGLFLDCVNLVSVDISEMDTSQVEDMSHMFKGCSSLLTVNLLGHDLSKVNNVKSMFEGCSSIITINIGELISELVDSTTFMFYGCNALVNVDLSLSNTINVTDMSYMFYQCNSLATIDLSSFDTSKVTNMAGMFAFGNSLTSLDLSHFSTSLVTNMSWMFEACSAMTSLNVSTWNTSNVETMAGMFNDCSSLLELDVSSFNTNKVVNFSWCFYNCRSLNRIDTSNFTGTPTNITGMFTDCLKLKRLDLRGLNASLLTSENVEVSFSDCFLVINSYARTQADADILNSGFHRPHNVFFVVPSTQARVHGTNKDTTTFDQTFTNETDLKTFITAGATTMDSITVETPVGFMTNCSQMFKDSQATSLDITRMDTGAVTDMSEMFYGSQATNLSVSEMDTGQATTMYRMFQNSQAHTLDTVLFDTGNVTNMYAMFDNVLPDSLNVSNFNTSKVTDMGAMFNQTKTDTLDVSNFDTSKVTSMRLMFQASTASTIIGLETFNTENVTNMEYMFFNSKSLALNLISFDTSKVTNMSAMFGNSFAAIIILTSFNTSNVINMSNMFAGAVASEFDVSNFNTSKVTDMSGMFTSVEPPELDLSNFDTSEVTTMFGMFAQSSTLHLDLSSFNTSKVTNMGAMFEVADATTINLSSFDTSKVTDMGNMFYANKATTLDLAHFNTSNVLDMSLMFRDSVATYIDVSNFDTSKVTTMSQMFYRTVAPSLDLGSFDLTNIEVGNMNGMFRYAEATTGYAKTQADADKLNSTSNKPSTLVFEVKPDPARVYGTNKDTTTFDETFTNETELKAFITAGATTMDSITVETPVGFMTNCSAMFSGSQATSINISGMNTSAVTTMNQMFQNCSSLTSLDLSSFNTSNTTIMNAMFMGCSSLTSLNLSSFNTSKVVGTSQMFQNCSSLTSLDLSSFDTSKLTSTGSMFNGCTNLTTINLSSFNTINITNMGNMFNGCSSLTSLDLSSFNTSNVTSMTYMFNGCSSLTILDLSSFDTSKVTNLTGTFNLCSSVEQSWAKTQADADRLNASSNKPSNVVFEVKSVTPVGRVVGTKTDMVSVFSEEFTNETDLKAYITENGATIDTITVETPVGFMTDCSNMFSTLENATAISVGSMDTSAVTTMAYMFGGCLSLVAPLDVSSLDTSNVTDMSGMFSETNVETLNLSNFNTSKVTLMVGMFFGTTATSINVSSFDTSKVTVMNAMFGGINLTTLDLSNFNTSAVQGMNNMFIGSTITTLDLSSFNTTQLLSMYNMFYGATISTLDLSSFSTSTVIDMDGMFYQTNIETIDLSSFDMSNVSTTIDMFNGTTATIGYAKTQADADILNATSNKPSGLVFEVKGAPTLTGRVYGEVFGIESPPFDETFTNETDLKAYINSNYHLISTITIETPAGFMTDCSQMFRGWTDTYIDLSAMDTSAVTNMSQMFENTFMPIINLSGLDTSNVINMRGMFVNSNFTELDLSSFDTSKVTDMSYMFYNAYSSKINMSNFNTNKVTTMQGMFNESNATELDLSSFDMGHNPIDTDMFIASSATIGYAKTQADADILNATSNKPSGLVFEIKSAPTLTGRVYGSNVNSIPFDQTFTNETDLKAFISENSLYDIIVETPAGFMTDCSSMFTRFVVNNVDVSGMDTSAVTNMSKMFYDKWKVVGLDTLDTSAVTNMSQMFYRYYQNEIDLSSFDTTNVTDMTNMFEDAATTIGWARTQADADRLNESSGKPIELVFEIKPPPIVGRVYGTNKDTTTFDQTFETETELKAFITAGATTMDSITVETPVGFMTNCVDMFENSQATSIDVSGMDTSAVTSMNSMFAYSQATTLDLSSFDTSKVTNMGAMLRNTSATTINVSNFNTSKVTVMTAMFRNSTASVLDLSSFTIEKTPGVNNMFNGADATIGWVGSTEVATRFNNSSNKPSKLTFTIKPIGMGSVHGEKFDGTTFNEVFENETVLKEFITSVKSSAKTITVETPVGFMTNCASMFNSANAISINLKNMDTSAVTNMTQMFGYSKANIIDLSSFDFSNNPTTNWLFHESDTTLCLVNTQADADIINASLGKPATLSVVTELPYPSWVYENGNPIEKMRASTNAYMKSNISLSPYGSKYSINAQYEDPAVGDVTLCGIIYSDRAYARNGIYLNGTNKLGCMKTLHSNWNLATNMNEYFVDNTTRQVSVNGEVVFTYNLVADLPTPTVHFGIGAGINTTTGNPIGVNFAGILGKNNELAKLYEGETLVAHFICYKTFDNEIGCLDLISKTFYPSANTSNPFTEVTA